MTETPASRAPRSLSRRLLLLSAVWIGVLLGIGGFGLDRAMGAFLRANFDEQLGGTLTAMIAAAEIGPEGEARFGRALADQRFFEPYSGLYWQVVAPGQALFRSRSLWDRRLTRGLPGLEVEPRSYTYAAQGFAGDPVRVVERDAVLPGSGTVFRFQVAESTHVLAEQVERLRQILFWLLGILGVGLFALAIVQATFGLRPLRGVRRAIAAIRTGEAARVPADFPPEIMPLVTELNALLEHTHAQAEEARRHAGNLAHALKTPMSVLLNEARDSGEGLAASVETQLATMRRHVDHHLARARALGRRGASSARAPVWPALEAIARAVERMHADREPVIDLVGARELVFQGERQDLEEMLGNLLDNAVKYGCGRVFVTVSAEPGFVSFEIEDDGPGIPPGRRDEIFGRGVRLDTSKPGTGLGLAITRDVAEIYGGTVELGESEDLGGLMARLRLPTAA